MYRTRRDIYTFLGRGGGGVRGFKWEGRWQINDVVRELFARLVALLSDVLRA